jgi:predicted lipoprotein with Yx(FWY)xxD motif
LNALLTRVLHRPFLSSGVNVTDSRIRYSRLGALVAALALAACSSMGMQGMSMTDMPAKKAADGTLTNASGMTLYTFDKDAAGKSACNGPCAANWPPLMAASGASASADWTIVTRDDGSKQWAYKGKPLYTWVKDQKAGDKTGDGFANNAWHTAKE